MPFTSHNVKVSIGLPDHAIIEAIFAKFDWAPADFGSGTFRPTGPVVQSTAQVIEDVPLLPERCCDE